MSDKVSDNVTAIYKRVFGDLIERLVELGFLRDDSPKLICDDAKSTTELKLYSAKSWANEEHKHKISDTLYQLKWDTSQYFVHYILENEEYRSVIVINEKACKLYCELYLVEFDEVVEIALLYALSQWVLHKSVNTMIHAWTAEAMQKEDAISQEFMITWSQLMVYKAIENRPKMVNAFNEMLPNQSPQYSIWKVIKNRSFEDVFHDMISIKQSPNYSLSNWREIMQDNNFWLNKFSSSLSERKHIDRFFNNEASYTTIAIWFEKQQLSYERDLLPYVKRMGMELDESFFDRISFSDYSFDGIPLELKIYNETLLMKRLSFEWEK